MSFNIKKLATAVALAIPFIAVSAETTLAQSASYGAISYSTSTGATGWSKDYANQGAAERRANTECERYSGSQDCKTVVWVRNACAVLATADNRAYGWAWNVNQTTATQRALEECSQRGSTCKVRHIICPGR
jgi:serine/threonine-protein kinase